MNTRELGRDGILVGEVGLGCWQLGGTEWGDLDEDKAQAILKAAVASGTTLFDTANIYGNGRSEKLIGRFLRAGSGEGMVHVITKTGRGEMYPDGYSKEAIRESVHGSLQRLGLERLDLLQLHCVPPEVLRDGVIFQWLRELRDEGLIQYFGASVETVEEGLLCLAAEGLQTLQVIFNPFRQKLVKELFPQAQEKGVGIIVRLPLASGLLTGKFTADSTFAANDHRTFNRDGQHFNAGETFAGLPFEKGVELAEELKSHVPEGMTMAQMTLRWILDHEAVSVIIPGASSPEQADENATATSLDALPPELHEFLRQFYDSQVREHIRGVY